MYDLLKITFSQTVGKLRPSVQETEGNGDLSRQFFDLGKSEEQQVFWWMSLAFYCQSR